MNKGINHAIPYESDLNADLEFLLKLQESMGKGFDGDWRHRDHAREMVADWIEELQRKKARIESHDA